MSSNEAVSAVRTEIRVPSGLGSATIHEAARRRGALPSTIKPVHQAFEVEGPAFTVQCPPGDNLWIHRAVYAASAGDILVVDVSGHTEAGYWGEILSRAAAARGLGGLVINGGVRDVRQLGQVGFPVFATGICIQGTTKGEANGRLGGPVRVGSVIVEPGDFVAGDLDGVVVVPAAEVDAVLAAAEQRVVDEDVIMRRIENGETTLQVLGLDS